MGKLKIMTNKAIKKSNSEAVKKYIKNTNINTSRHFAKLHGGFEDPRGNAKLNKLTADLKRVNKLNLEFKKKNALPEYKSKALRIANLNYEQLAIQNEINKLLQEIQLRNIERAFGEHGIHNSNITKEQLAMVETKQKQLFSKLNKLSLEKRNIALKEMTGNLNRVVADYLGRDIYKIDGRKNHILISKLLITFEQIEQKYLNK